MANKICVKNLENSKILQRRLEMGVHGCSVSWAIACLTCYVTSQDNTIEGPCDFMMELLVACYHPGKFGYLNIVIVKI